MRDHPETTTSPIDNDLADIKAQGPLTSEQKITIIKAVVERYPEKSDGQIAEIAGVSALIIAEHRKPVPKRCKITREQRLAIMVLLEVNPNDQKQIAEQLGLTIGTVAGIKYRMRGKARRKAAPRPLASRIEERTRSLPRFDSLTREERGMGTREFGAQQHPEAPVGWTRDDVHRRDHGRIVLHTPAETAKHQRSRRFSTVVGELAKFVRLLNEVAPEDLDAFDADSFDMFAVQMRKLAPEAIARLQALLDKIGLDDHHLTEARAPAAAKSAASCEP